MSDREPSPGSPAAENRAATSNPNSATRSHARWRSPQSNRPCACGNSAPAVLTVLPSSARNRAGTPSRQKGRNRRRSALPEADRKTHGPVSAASPPRSRSDRLADRPRAPSPFRKSRSLTLHHTESTKPDFVNGLIRGQIEELDPIDMVLHPDGDPTRPMDRQIIDDHEQLARGLADQVAQEIEKNCCVEGTLIDHEAQLAPVD